jgi:hypothetical protein
MGFHHSDALMEPLVALPDRSEARLAVARTGSEAPELGHTPPHLTQRRRSLRRGAARRPGIPRVPRPWCKHHVARRLGIGATRHGKMGEPPGDHEIARHGLQPPLICLQASRLTLTSLREPPAQACYCPPTPIPRHHGTGTREICHGQAREHEPCNRLRAARWSVLRGIDRHDLGWHFARMMHSARSPGNRRLASSNHS